MSGRQGSATRSRESSTGAVSVVLPAQKETTASSKLALATSGPSSLPHPSTYSGSDNWALSPNGDLPSLPGTPSKAMRALGWQPPTASEAALQTTPGREGSAARALMAQRRLDSDNRAASSTYRNASPSPLAVQRNSPRLSHADLGLGTPTSPPFNAGDNGSSLRSPLGPYQNSISAALGVPGEKARNSMAQRDSPTSIGQGRQPSLAFSRVSATGQLASPAPSAVSTTSHSSSLRPSMAGPRVYRPPHLRSDSTYALKPKMAHYDRVSAQLRGQTRSPDPSRGEPLSHISSAAVSRTSRTPSGTHSPHPRLGRRRMSSSGSFYATAEQAPDTTAAFDTNSLIAKLASAKLDMGTRSSNSPSAAGSRSEQAEDADGADRESVVDDIDFTAEDMMMTSNGSITDGFYRSRTGSVAGQGGTVIDILEVGDRLGPGMMHDGYEITIAETSAGFRDQEEDWTGTQLEVMSKLGEGSYAVVYLVKEVARLERGQTEADTSRTYDALEPSTLRADVSLDGDATVLQHDEDALGKTLQADRHGRLAENANKSENAPKEKYFALKCLCKRDLSETMLEVQRLEATIHQSLPSHPNIVSLYRTYETPEWLFLVLEYCPGQDLFYWLEQAQDTQKLGTVTPGGVVSPFGDADGSTPPSPGLLASKTSRFLLSRRRLRLISRMFQQMCDAVAFCHARGVAHRDLKPENFIVEDAREDGAEANGAITVKLTDFGLAVAQTRCIDFDCGSKPYMSFECRNNKTQWYNPLESDVWSLGVVLLNLIFHRSPFYEPNAERCPSFAAYVDDPVFFLTTAFRGLKSSAAEYLAEHVFCDVTEGSGSGEQRHRITAQELGRWASDLEEHLEVPAVEATFPPTPGETVSDAGADHDKTLPLWHSRSPSSSVVNSMMSSPQSNHHAASSIHQELMSMGIPEDEIDTFTPLFGDAVPPIQPRKPRGQSVSRRLSDNYQDRPATLEEESEEPEAREAFKADGLAGSITDSAAPETLAADSVAAEHSLRLSTGSPVSKKGSISRGRGHTEDVAANTLGQGRAQALNIPQSGWRRPPAAGAQATVVNGKMGTHGADQSSNWRDTSRSMPTGRSVDMHASPFHTKYRNFQKHSPPSVESSTRFSSPASEVQNWRHHAKPVNGIGAEAQSSHANAAGVHKRNAANSTSLSPPTSLSHGRPPASNVGNANNAKTQAIPARSVFGLSAIGKAGAAPPLVHGREAEDRQESNIAKLFAEGSRTLGKKRSVANVATWRPNAPDRSVGGIRGGALASSVGRPSGLAAAAPSDDVVDANSDIKVKSPGIQEVKTVSSEHDEQAALPRKKMFGKLLQGVKDSYSRNAS